MRKHGARNDIPAKVTAIKRGGVMAQVEVERVGTRYRMSSVMTIDSMEELGLEESDTIPVLAEDVPLVKPQVSAGRCTRPALPWIAPPTLARLSA